MTPTKKKSNFGIVDIGAAACAACCAGPFLAILGGVTIAGMAGTMFVGAASLVVAVVAAIAHIWVRHHRRSAAIAIVNSPIPFAFTTEPAPAGAAPNELAREGVR